MRNAKDSDRISIVRGFFLYAGNSLGAILTILERRYFWKNVVDYS